MLPRKNRLKRKKEFERVFKEGETKKEDFLFLKWLKNNLPISRFSFVVSRKISRKATQRNKIRRRLREIVRLKIPKIKKGIDGILVALPGLEKKDFLEIKETIEKIFKKAKLYED